MGSFGRSVCTNYRTIGIYRVHWRGSRLERPGHVIHIWVMSCPWDIGCVNMGVGQPINTRRSLQMSPDSRYILITPSSNRKPGPVPVTMYVVNGSRRWTKIILAHLVQISQLCINNLIIKYFVIKFQRQIIFHYCRINNLKLNSPKSYFSFFNNNLFVPAYLNFIYNTLNANLDIVITRRLPLLNWVQIWIS